MQPGIVKFFNSEKGFGFVSPESGGADVFLHVTALKKANLSDLSSGQRVNFDIVERGEKRSVGRIELSAEPETNEISPLLQQSMARKEDYSEDVALAAIWDSVLEYIRTGSQSYVRTYYNSRRLPFEQSTVAALRGWCRLVALKPEFVISPGYQEYKGTSMQWRYDWELKLHRVSPPDTREKERLIREYGIPPGY